MTSRFSFKNSNRRCTPCTCFRCTYLPTYHSTDRPACGAFMKPQFMKTAVDSVVCMCRSFGMIIDYHLLPGVTIDNALAGLCCGTREGTAAGNLDSEHLPKAVVVGRKKPVAPCVVRIRARPAGYQKPRTIVNLKPRPAQRRGCCCCCCCWYQAESEKHAK